MSPAAREWVRCAEEDYAVNFRYPEHIATRADARQALTACHSLRADIRLSLGLPRT